MNTKILIIGQGISGTLLSWFLYQNSIPFLIIDEPKENTASKVAAGILNPVTGRRIVKTWMIEEIMPFAISTYKAIGDFLNIETYSQKNIIDFFPTQQMKTAFEERVAEQAEYLNLDHSRDFTTQFNYHYGYGNISPSYTIHLQEILMQWRHFLSKKELLLEAFFTIDELHIGEEKITYQNIVADKIIFADGINCYDNKWFKNLPFAFNKGEALMVDIPHLSTEYIYKKGLTICPLTNGLFWVGSNYVWSYKDDSPTEAFKNNTIAFLKEWLKLDFTVVHHNASIRPANIERRPFVGFHPKQKNVGILNGMGAKGSSLAPFFANELVQHLIHNTLISADADVQRFTKVLSR